MTVIEVSGVCLSERRDRRILFAEFLADFAEREPGGDEIRRQFDRLQQKIGGGGQIALQLQVARKLEAAVSHQIAGRQE